jgi:hypothetical protein
MPFLMEKFYPRLVEKTGGGGLMPESVIEAFHMAMLGLRESTRNDFQ